MSLPNRLTSDEWVPKNKWPRRGSDIARATLFDNQVYLQGKNGDIYRVWLGFDGVPLIECVEYNGALPKEPGMNELLQLAVDTDLKPNVTYTVNPNKDSSHD